MTEETVESNAKTQGGQPPPLQQTYNSKIFLSLSCLCQNCPGFIFFVTDFQWIPFLIAQMAVFMVQNRSFMNIIKKEYCSLLNFY